MRLLDRKFAQQYGPAYRSLLPSNRRITTGDRDLPLASIDQLDDVFDALEKLKRPNDRFIVLLSGHGGKELLEVEQDALYPRANSRATASSNACRQAGRGKACPYNLAP